LIRLLAGFLAKNGLKILGTAISAGIGYGDRGSEGAMDAVKSALQLPPDADSQSVLEAAKQPGGLAALRAVENQIPLEQIKADTVRLEANLFTVRELAGLEVTDRASARQMFTTTNEGTPKHLTWLICLLWISMVMALFFVHIPPENRELIIRMQGTLDGAIASTIMFWLGSSFGSRSKDGIFGKALEK